MLQDRKQSVWPPAQNVTRTGSGWRWASALVLAPIAVAVCWVGGWLFAAVIMFFAVLMAYEWIRLVTGRSDYGLIALLSVGPVAAVVAAKLAGAEGAIATLAVSALVGAILSKALRCPMFWFVFGMFYIGLPALSILSIREQPTYGRELMLTVFFVAWAADSGAYLVGKSIGGPKLVPKLSPSKTWAGLAGAAFFGGIFAVFSAILNNVAPLTLYLFLGILIALLVQIGDLLESGLKRRFDAKDSGDFIPGHGGVMDRLDGLAFASVFVAIAVNLLLI